MRRLFSMVAMLVLALWLPATQHCALEAAGCLPAMCAEPCADSSGHDDGCDVVENGLYKPSLDFVKAPAPALQFGVCLLCLTRVQEQILVVHTKAPPNAVDRPREWVAVWQFVQRAAPPSRAPSSFLA
jgi:hypothetical protein